MIGGAIFRPENFLAFNDNYMENSETVNSRGVKSTYHLR